LKVVLFIMYYVHYTMFERTFRFTGVDR
jgi:hypothetical protein